MLIEVIGCWGMITKYATISDCEFKIVLYQNLTHTTYNTILYSHTHINSMPSIACCLITTGSTALSAVLHVKAVFLLFFFAKIINLGEILTSSSPSSQQQHCVVRPQLFNFSWRADVDCLRLSRYYEPRKLINHVMYICCACFISVHYNFLQSSILLPTSPACSPIRSGKEDTASDGKPRHSTGGSRHWVTSAQHHWVYPQQCAHTQYQWYSASPRGYRLQ